MEMGSPPGWEGSPHGSFSPGGTFRRLSASGDPEFALIEQQADRFGGLFASREAFTELLKYHDKTTAPPPPPLRAPGQVNVPVFLTLMIKSLDDGENGELVLNGTLVHRSVFFDMRRLRPEDSEGALGPSMFKVRLNDGPEAAGLINERKCVLSPVLVDSRDSSTGAVRAAPSDFRARCTTASFKLPMHRRVVLNAQPFEICAATILLELTSFVGEVLSEKEVGECDTVRKLLRKLRIPSALDVDDVRDAMCSGAEYGGVGTDGGATSRAPLGAAPPLGDVPLDVLLPRTDAVLDAWFRELGVSVFDRMRLLDALRGRIAGYMKESSQPYEFRPELLCHHADARNLVSVRDWATGLDNMRGYDIINPNPCVEVVLNCKRDEDSMQAVYTPKIRLTWYLESDWVQSFLNIFMPTLFIAIGSIVNSVTLSGAFGNDDDDDTQKDAPHGYLAITIHLGLTLSVIISTLAKSDSIRNEFDLNKAVGAILFLGIILASIGALGLESRPKWIRFWIPLHCLSWGCLLIGVLIAPLNQIRFLQMKRFIRDYKPERAGPDNFLGRPGSSPNRKGSDANLSTLTPFWGMSDAGKVEINPTLLEGDVWKASKDASGNVASVYAGLRPEDLAERPFCSFGPKGRSSELSARVMNSRSLLRRGSEEGYFVLEA